MKKDDGEEITLNDFTYEKRGIELPENIVFYVDSSGSMLSPGGTGIQICRK